MSMLTAPATGTRRPPTSAEAPTSRPSRQA